MSVHVYTCAACGGTFVQDEEWTDADAMAVAARTFSAEELVGADVVCEDCWQAMNAALPDLAARYEAAGRAEGN